MSNQQQPEVTVPRRFLVEVIIALRAANTIGKRSCRSGDGLNWGGNERLAEEAHSHLDAIGHPFDADPERQGREQREE